MATKLAEEYEIYPSYFCQMIRTNWAYFQPHLNINPVGLHIARENLKQMIII